MASLVSSRGVALVTGAADRIGAAIALGLARTGYRIVIHYRSQERNAEAIARQIAQAGGEVAIIMADLAKRSDRMTLIDRASKPFGPLTVLVNNASAFEPDSALDVDEVLWDQHFAVHTEAPVFLARDFAAQLPAGAEGNVINIIDERVLYPSPAYFSYSLSKAALWNATQIMAQSLAPRIRVNAIGPGPTLPARRQSRDDFANSQASLPLQHGASLEEIANGVLFLLSSASMTGQMLTLDGGRHLQHSVNRGMTPRRK